MKEQELTITVPWWPTLLPKRLAQRALIVCYARALNFPDYYSSNWDSFEEIMNDLAEATARPIRISHGGRKERYESDYVRILDDISVRHGSLVVSFRS